MPIKINGTTSGSVTLNAPASGSDVTVTLPSAAGTLFNEPGAWTAYTPTWGGNSTNPVIGNGSIAGAYCQIGKIVHARVIILPGSTTTFGSGAYYLSAPVTMKSTNHVLSSGFFGDSSAGTRYTLQATPASTTNLWVRYGASALDFTATAPVTLANTDEIQLAFTYEAA